MRNFSTKEESREVMEQVCEVGENASVIQICRVFLPIIGHVCSEAPGKSSDGRVDFGFPRDMLLYLKFDPSSVGLG